MSRSIKSSIVITKPDGLIVLSFSLVVVGTILSGSGACIKLRKFACGILVVLKVNINHNNGVKKESKKVRRESIQDSIFYQQHSITTPKSIRTICVIAIAFLVVVQSDASDCATAIPNVSVNIVVSLKIIIILNYGIKK
jgi:hypothetical protein